MVRAENVYKIFGPAPEQAMELLLEGRGKDEIRERTGCVVGVNNVSFELEPGEIFVIMGLSGSGKSTLLRCVNRLIEPTSGRIFLTTDDGDKEITALDERNLREVRKTGVSMVFQRFGLLPHRNVRENVAYGLEIQGLGAEERKRTAEELLELVGLGGWGDSYVDELSGGMQQRVGLARALATQAPVLLMDEPFSALDPLIKVNMQNELLRIQQELHRTLLFITHDLDEALRIGSRIAIMEEGRVVQQGTPEEIIVNPQTEYVADFVEHADPTGVMTALTVAQALPGERFEAVGREGDVTLYARRGFPDVRIGVDVEDRLAFVRAYGANAEVCELEAELERPEPQTRRRDLALSCGAGTTLRQILRGRNRSVLPAIVVDEERRVLGVVGERELVQGILDKRAAPASLGSAQPVPLVK